MNWDDPDALAAELAALPSLTNAVVDGSEADWLIDAVHPGAPLLITFSYVTWKQEPPFYLFGRSKKWESMTGRPLNRVLLRDRRFHWLLYGVPSLGDDVDQVAARLRRLIELLRPREVWCVGDSMGGYAAAMFGFLLDADRIVAISPLSDFDPARARVHHEKRFIWALDAIAAAPPAAYYDDLPLLASACGYRGQLHLVVGGTGTIGVPDTVGFDMMHAYRFGRLPGLHVYCVPEADHDHVAWTLRRDGKIDALLMGCLYDLPLDDVDEVAFDRHTPRLHAPPGGREAGAAGGRRPAPGRCVATLPALDARSAAAAEADDATALVDRIVPGAPLLLSFGDVGTDGIARFDWFDTSAQLQQLCGFSINRILLRDPDCQWWLRGARTIGEDWQDVRDWLERWIEQMQPSRLVCAGNGVGGYAAILFAMLLQADHAFVLNPLSLLDAGFARACHDPRHLVALDRLDAEPLPDAPRDLLRLAERSGYRGGLDVVYAAQPPVLNWHSGSHNAVHAVRLGLLPGARLHPVGEAVDGELLHRLAFYRVLAPMLQRLAFGVAQR